MKRRLLQLFMLVLMVIIAWTFVRRIAPQLKAVQWSDLHNLRPSFTLLILSFAILVGVQVFNAILWRRVAVDLGSPAPNARATLHTYFVSSLGRYIPGKVWQIAGLAAIGERFGMSASRAAAASIIAQIVFLSTGLVFLGATLPGLQKLLAGSGELKSGGLIGVHPVIYGIVIMVLAALAAWVFVATPIGRGLREFVVSRAGEKTGRRLREALALADSVRPSHAIQWAIGYLLSWALLGIAFATFVVAFVPTAVHSMLFLGGIVAASYLTGWINIMIPAGIGVREGVMWVLLVDAGVNPATAVIISAFSRLWFTAAELLPITFIPLLKPGGVTPAAPDTTMAGIQS